MKLMQNIWVEGEFGNTSNKQGIRCVSETKISHMMLERSLWKQGKK